jgi:hypothetical protein
MKTLFNAKMTAVAVAVLFAGGAAYASGPGDHGGHDGNDQGFSLGGRITVNAGAGASVNSAQDTGDVVLMLGNSGDHGGQGDHGDHGNAPGTTIQAAIGNNAANGAKGNIALNSAAGMQNVQSNDAAVAAIAAQNVFGTASVANAQSAMGNGLSGNNYTVTASLGDSALAGSSGNIAVNVAAGVGNAQSNGMAVTQSANPVLAMATATNVQTASGNTQSGNFTNTAAIGGNALMNASGNIGVNVASGVGNLQHNGLSLIVAP